MGFRKVTYVLAKCDGCGPDWWQATAETAPHFESPLVARKQLAQQFGWRIVKRFDGRHQMLCPRCATRSDCDLYGCDWPDASGDTGAAGGKAAVRLQTCRRCSRIYRADQPPAGHPDSVVADLPDWLADLDAALFPEETS